MFLKGKAQQTEMCCFQRYGSQMQVNQPNLWRWLPKQPIFTGKKKGDKNSFDGQLL